MSAPTINVFFYGLFMDADALRAKGFRPVGARRASVSGMALIIGRRATLVTDPSKCVHGFVMGLSHREVRELYSEPSVADYRPEAVIAQLADRSCVPALCFNLPPSDEPLEANPEYAAKLREVVTRLGLPADYAASIR
jgi:Gamma-glutamyl cyclotransferase, AIG2-like